MTDLAMPPDTDLAEEAIDLVRRWLREAAAVPVDGSAAQLAGLLRDPNGLAFAVGFVDGVVRPEDVRVSARALAALAPDVPRFLPAPLRAAVRVGGRMAPIMPGVVVPIARRVLRRMVGHLIVDATDARLGRAIARIRRRDVRLNVNLLGEAVLGRGEATRRLRETERLLARDDVDYVSIKVSATVAPHNPWAFDEAVDDIVERAHPAVHPGGALADAQVRQPRHGGVQGPRPHHRGLHPAAGHAGAARPRGRDRAPGVPSGLARRDDPPPGVGRPASGPGRRRHQGPPGQGRQPADGAGRGHGARLAAGDLGEQAGHRHQLQAGPRLRAAAGARPQRPDRRGRAQPVRRRLRVAAGRSARRPRRHRVRDAARHGRGPGRGGPARGGWVVALHPGRTPGAVRRRHRLPDPPPRGGREPGQLHVRRVRTGPTSCSTARSHRFLASLADVDDTVPAPNRVAGPLRRDPGPRAGPLREHPGHRPVRGRQPDLGPCRPVPVALLDARRGGDRGGPDHRGRPAGRGAGRGRRGVLGRRRSHRRAAPGRRRPRGAPRRPHRGDGRRGRQDRRPGRPRDLRGRRLRPLLRRTGRRSVPGGRRDAGPGPGHPGHAAVELPGRHPGRLAALRPRGRLRRGAQAGRPGASAAARCSPRSSGPRCPTRGCSPSCRSASGSSAAG